MKYDQIICLPACNDRGEIFSEPTPKLYLLRHTILAVTPEGQQGTFSSVVCQGVRVYVPLPADEIAKRLGWTEDGE